jgi:glycerol-3-phosphate dehydrogenase (NAD(P)+)
MNQQVHRIGIIGAGSWATALCKIFSGSGMPVSWWFHRKEDAALFSETGHNPRYLTDIDFNGLEIEAETDLPTVVQKSDLLLIAVPSAFVASVLAVLSPDAFRNKSVITSVKGILPEELMLVSDYLQNAFSLHPNQIAVIAGPCHAEEVALEKQSYLTVASPSAAFRQMLKEKMEGRFIRVKVSEDADGVEWAAILKNVYAIACGVCHGLGFGDNFQAVLVSNAMQEMQFFLDSHLPSRRNTLESAYLGDLLVTAYSVFSRNRTFGNMIGRGYGVRAAQIELGMVAEGYYAVKGLHQLREKLGISLPIADAMHAILYEHVPARDRILALKGILS